MYMLEIEFNVLHATMYAKIRFIVQFTCINEFR